MPKEVRPKLSVSAVALSGALVIGAVVLVLYGPTFLDVDLGDLRGGAGDLLMVAVGAGLLSMAIIQIVKDLIGARAAFNKRAIGKWLASVDATRLAEVVMPTDHELADPNSRLEFSRLGKALGPNEVGALLKSDRMDLIVTKLEVRDEPAFFSQPIEFICGQLGTVAELAVGFPEENRSLLLILAGPHGLQDASRYILGVLGLSGGKEDSNGGDEIDSPKSSSNVLGSEENDQGESEDVFRHRSQVTHHIQRNIDELQVSVGYRWRRLIRSCAVGLCALLVVGIAGASGLHSQVVALLATGTLGGFFSWFFRDLAAILERSRAR